MALEHIRNSKLSRVAGVCLALCWILLSACAESRAETRTPVASVRDAQLVSDTVGWALTDQRLEWTSDFGSTWRDITPPEVSPEAIRGAFFQDTAYGLVTVSGGSDQASGTQVTEFVTHDAGVTWTPVPVTTMYAEIASSSMSFVGPTDGWLMIRLASGSNFSRGALFRTEDGGATWSPLPVPPSGNLIRFVDKKSGWLLGGPIDDKLFVTEDAGETWTAQQLGRPSSLAGSIPTYQLPTFLTSRNAVLPVTFHNADESVLVTYTSHDSGRTWSPSQPAALSSSLGVGVPMPAAVIDELHLVSASDSARVYKTSDAGGRWTATDTRGFPAGRTVTDLKFSSAEIGWARTSYDWCQQFKSQCTSEDALFASKDGGASWVLLRP